jgi:hypothetical protein
VNAVLLYEPRRLVCRASPVHVNGAIGTAAIPGWRARTARDGCASRSRRKGGRCCGVSAGRALRVGVPREVRGPIRGTMRRHLHRLLCGLCCTAGAGRALRVGVPREVREPVGGTMLRHLHRLLGGCFAPQALGVLCASACRGRYANLLVARCCATDSGWFAGSPPWRALRVDVTQHDAALPTRVGMRALPLGVRCASA